MTDKLTEGMRRALEKVSLLAFGDSPGKFNVEDLRGGGNAVPESPDEIYDAYFRSTWTADAGAILTYKLLMVREGESGISIEDQLAELHRFIAEMEVGDDR